MRLIRYGLIAALLALGAVQVHAAAVSATKQVTIKTATGGNSFVFKPAKKTIQVGTKVTWKNPTEAPHTVTSKTKGWTFNKTFDPGKTVSFTFKKAGTYKYVCTFHPGMAGTIVVK